MVGRLGVHRRIERARPDAPLVQVLPEVEGPPIDAYFYDIFRPHMLTSTPGPRPLIWRAAGPDTVAACSTSSTR